MNKKKIFLASILMAAMGVANAASVSLIYTGNNAIDEDGAIRANSGDVLSFDLVMDFGHQITLGGGFDVNWDTGGFGNPEYTRANFGDPLFARDPVVQDGRLFNGAVGSFDGLTIGTIASISFTVIGTEGEFGMTPSGTDGDSGPWIDGILNWDEPIVPDYNGVTVRVVPAPAAVWFLFSGLAVLFGFRPRQVAASQQ
ncbi:MAG: hypothetical protein AB8G17_04455 [Gammaproteobacteria bacterium]